MWFSHLVDSRGIDAIVLEKDVAHVLRSELTTHPRLERIIAVLTDAHRDEPPTIMLEETVNTLAVLRGREAIEDIDRELRAAIVAMRESDARHAKSRAGFCAPHRDCIRSSRNVRTRLPCC